MYPQLLTEDIVLEDSVFEKLGIFPDERRAMLAKLDRVRGLAGL
jgi:hypothetical protein